MIPPHSTVMSPTPSSRGVSIPPPTTASSPTECLPEVHSRRVFAAALRLVPDSDANRKFSTRRLNQVAVTVECTPEGATWVHVHVPDVAAYVPHDSALEIAARARQRSIYTPETSVTMFPIQLEASLCFPMHSQGPYATITYSLKVGKDSSVQDAAVCLSVVQSVSVLTYSQVESSRTPHVSMCKPLRDVAARNLQRRANLGAALVDFETLCSMEVMSQSAHCVTHEMILNDPTCVAVAFASAPVRVALSKLHLSVGYYIVRELEVMAGEAAAIASQRLGIQKRMTHGLQGCDNDNGEESFSFFMRSAILVPSAQRGDIISYVCDALRAPETNALVLRDAYERRGLGATILPATNPLGDYSELHMQYVLHAVLEGAPYSLSETEFHTLCVRAQIVESKVEKMANRRPELVTRWVAQQPPCTNENAVRRMKCIVLHRGYDRMVVLSPFLGHVFEVPGGMATWGAQETILVPLNCLCTGGPRRN